MIAQEIVLASNNPGKLRELRAVLAPLSINLTPQSEYNVPEAPEPHHTFIENALAKARHAAALTGKPALADDSGLCVRALGGAPGVYSAHYAGEPKSDAANNQKLLQALANVADKAAYYYCIVVFVRAADDPQPVIADGRWDGEITMTARGENGFGYDPYFWLPQFGKTAAELEPEHKNRLSHRAKALQALLEKFSQL